MEKHNQSTTFLLTPHILDISTFMQKYSGIRQLQMICKMSATLCDIMKWQYADVL